jgi:RNase H-like domain found in reverse transcriptase/Reverse transcriptase (RNA-dependent DNA polymerase)
MWLQFATLLWEWLCPLVDVACPSATDVPPSLCNLKRCARKAGFRLKSKQVRRELGLTGRVACDSIVHGHNAWQPCLMRMWLWLLLLSALVSGASCVGIVTGPSNMRDLVTLANSMGNTVGAGLGGEPCTRFGYTTARLQGHACIDGNLPTGAQYVAPHVQYEKDTEGGYVWGNHRTFSKAEMQHLKEKVYERRDVFAYSVTDLVGYSGLEGPFHITLKHANPIFEKERRHSHLEKQIIEETCKELLDNGLISPSPRDCQYASNLTLPAKKDLQGQWTNKRMCGDFRNINKATIKDKYGMPHVEDIFQTVGKALVFTKLDLRSGYHQIPVHPEDRSKTSFWWDHKLYMWNRMPFGNVNSTAHFSRVIDLELGSRGLSRCATSFVDDILVFSETPEQHIHDVCEVLDALYECGLRVHPDKSIFAAEVVEFLGHNVGPFGLTPHESKILTIQKMITPSTVSELRSVLGFLSYYRIYVPHFSKLASPLNKLLQKNVPWQWTPECDEALSKIKNLICEEGRVVKRFDPEKPLCLYTDWSCNGVGAILTQCDEQGREYIIACISRSLNKHEQNYSSYEGELLAVVWSCRTMRHYLHGTTFKIVTDHLPLTWLMNTQHLTGKHMRWGMILQELDFEILHRPGSEHVNADTPSRYPLAHTYDG